MSAVAIHDALTTGRMRAQSAALSDSEKRQVAEYLSGKSLDAPPSKLVKCAAGAKWFDTRQEPIGSGWGIDERNARLISAKHAGLSAAEVGSLHLKWAFSMQDASQMIAQPLLAGGALFIGSQDGLVYALDARSGCVHWTFKAAAGILGAVVMQRGAHGASTLFFSDRLAFTYAVDALTGAQRWRVKSDDHPSATIMGTPLLADGRLFVPIISFEESAGGAEYPCCTFRGSLVALEARTGKMIWRTYTIPNPAVEQFKNELGVPQFAPSGAGLWSSPTLDRKRSSIYFTTGNSYSEPADENGDAVFALDFKTGKIKWRTQTFANDSWTGFDYNCRIDPAKKNLPGCPSLKNPGPDIDFTTSPILVQGRGGKDMVVAGRKDGTTFGFDPDTGRILWSTRTSKDPDPNAGSLNFGLMAEGEKIFVPGIGTRFPNGGAFIASEDGGLYALDAFTGKRLWASKAFDNCDKPTPCMGLSFAPIGFPGVVFAGAADGYVRAYDSADGKVLWRFDTAQSFTALNGETAKGGAIGRNSIMIGRGMVYVGSGYSRVPGNVLLAFSVDGR